MKSVDKKKAFTIIELVVAMGLLVMLVGLSSVVFSTTVKAHRKATATIEITRKLNAITTQLNTDFRGLRKDGEIYLGWIARPELDEYYNIIDDDGDGIPDNYLKYDRMVFFADGDFQTMRQYGYDNNGDGTMDGSKTITGNLARVSYMLAKKNDGTPPEYIMDWEKRILSRTQHIVTGDNTLKPFPDPLDMTLAAWDPAAFDTDNFFNYEYQTMSMEDWTYLSTLYYTDNSGEGWTIKKDILCILTDMQFDTPSYTIGGPTVEVGDSGTYHNFFSEGVRDFGIQIWLDSEHRWFPEIDPNHDGDYSDTDYILDGSALSQLNFWLILYTGEESQFNIFGNALKFTFTLVDSRGIFPEGKTFTHIVYLDN